MDATARLPTDATSERPRSKAHACAQFVTNLYTNRKLYYVTAEAKNLLKPKSDDGTKRNVKIKGSIKVGESDAEGQKKAQGRLKRALLDQANKERKMIMIDLFQETKLTTIIETNNDRKSNPSLKNNEITTKDIDNMLN